jgi:hypothetical protein
MVEQHLVQRDQRAIMLFTCATMIPPNPTVERTVT